MGDRTITFIRDTGTRLGRLVRPAAPVLRRSVTTAVVVGMLTLAAGTASSDNGVRGTSPAASEVVTNGHSSDGDQVAAGTANSDNGVRGTAPAASGAVANDPGTDGANNVKAVSLGNIATIGAWRYSGWRGWQYVFNRWETNAIANWDGNQGSYAGNLMLGVLTAINPWAGASYYGLMGTYRWAAQQARSQGRCLAVFWWTGAAIVSC